MKATVLTSSTLKQPSSDQKTCRFSHHLILSNNNLKTSQPERPRAAPRKKTAVRKKTKCPISDRIQLLKLPVRKRTSSLPKGPARKKSKCPFSEKSNVPIDTPTHRSIKPKSDFSNIPTDLSRKKTPCNKSLKVLFSSQKPPLRKTAKPARTTSIQPQSPSSSSNKPRVPAPSVHKPRLSFSSKPKLPEKKRFRLKFSFKLHYSIIFRQRTCPCRAPGFPFRFSFRPPLPQDRPRFSSRFESVICEGRLGQFACPDGQRIRVESAVYGRQDEHTCVNYSTYGTKQNTACRRDVTPILREMCDHQTVCYIYVDNEEMGGDPCPRTHKYLSFTASCF
ncbi:uncharacterized protein LOC121519027 isoform X2 [Cheilinus undulatus]|nr:uncharacterized protein LOC121519027 isoform X2 [Cheilinus undulatus]